MTDPKIPSKRERKKRRKSFFPGVNNPVLAGKINQFLAHAKHGDNSKILEIIRQCNFCPLKPIIMPNGTKIMKCQHWEQDKIDCPIGKQIYINTLKMYGLAEREGVPEAMKFLASQQYGAAVMSSHVEMLMKGHPGFYTNEFMKNAVDTLDKVEKHKSGEKHHIIQENKISFKDILDEIKNKPVDAEIKKEDDTSGQRGDRKTGREHKKVSE